MEDCIFCKISRGKISSKRIYENDNFFSIYDINPALEGHSIVISKKHFDSFLDVPSSLGDELIDCIKKTIFKTSNKFKAEGFNLINNTKKIAGQIVPHFHIHIIPRKKSDNAILKFIDKDTQKSIELKDNL